MAYGVMSFNGGLGNIEMMPAAVTKYERFATGVTNAVQMDTLLFSDFIHSATSSATVPVSGGCFYTPVANGGGVSTNATADYASFGINNSIGVIRLTSGTTNNATGYAAITTANALVDGIPAPTNGFITKYECEVSIENDATIFGAARNGSVRFGLMSGNINTAPTDGVYLEFLYDGTTNDTNWNIVFRRDGSQERFSTGVAYSASTPYRLYLCVERDTSSVYTTTYKIKNLTTGVETVATQAPVSTASYPADTGTNYMGFSLVYSKAGTATTNSTFMISDYMCVRIRKKLDREMVILGT